MATDTDAGQSFHWGTEIHAIAYIRHSGHCLIRRLITTARGLIRSQSQFQPSAGYR